MTKQELMTRYAAAKFAKYLKTLGGEHEAKIATKFAVEYEEDDFRSYVRQQGEIAAMQILAEDVEDAEKSAALA